MIRKTIVALAAVTMLALPTAAMAAPPGYNLSGFSPDPTTVGEPGCFGQWRGAVMQDGPWQSIGFENGGQYLASQAGDNAANNVRDKTVYCGL